MPDQPERPPMPEEMAHLQEEGWPVLWDEEAGQWVLGDDIGEDLD